MKESANLPEKDGLYGWVVVFSNFFIAFLVGGFIFYSFTAFFEVIVKDMGFTYTQVSLAGSLRGLEMGLFAPFAGYLVDRFGARKLAVFGIITAGAGMVLLGFVKSLSSFYGAFLLIALGAGFCSTVVLVTSVVSWFDKRQGLAIGIVTSGFALSGIALPLVVWLIDKYEWRNTLILVGLFVWVFGLPLSLLIKENPSKKEKALKIVGSFKEVIKEKEIFLLSLSEALRFMIVSTIVIHIMPYLSNIGVERTKASFIASLIPLLSIFGRFGFGFLSDLFEKRFVMVITHGLVGLGMFFLYERSVLPFILLFSVGYGGGITLRGVLLSSYFDTRTYGKALGIVMGFSSLGGIFGPSLAGLIYDLRGAYNIVWLTYIFVSLFSMLIILSLKRPKGDPQNF